MGRPAAAMCSPGRLAAAVLLFASLLCSGIDAARAEGPGAADDFQQFLDEMRAAARAEGLSGGGLRAILRPITLDAEVIELARVQPEHERTAQSYVGGLLSPERIGEGRRLRRALAAELARIERAFGVDRSILLAIWGIETSFGAAMGTRPVTRSLASLAFADKRRAPFWRAELMAGLRILESGDVTLDDLVGSWAGAMGHTQFMPSSYLAHAVDFDADGRRDLFRAPLDALASTANYLSRFGWMPGQPWGFPVSLPKGFDYAYSSPGRALAPAAWQAMGILVRSAASRPRDAPLQLLLPAGATGPAFLTTANFEVLLAYNRSSLYALAVALLADHIAADDLLPLPLWPDGDRPLPMTEREEIQRLLAARGHDTGGIDGVLGFKSRAAIRSFQRELALPEDGHPSFDILTLLRAASPPP